MPRKLTIGTQQIEALRASLRAVSGTPVGSCPPESELLAFLAGRIDPARHDALKSHLSSCPECVEEAVRLADLVAPWLGEDGAHRLQALQSKLIRTFPETPRLGELAALAADSEEIPAFALAANSEEVSSDDAAPQEWTFAEQDLSVVGTRQPLGEYHFRAITNRALLASASLGFAVVSSTGEVLRRFTIHLEPEIPGSGWSGTWQESLELPVGGALRFEGIDP